MSAELGNGSEDWSYLHHPPDDAADVRWALLPLALVRGVTAWITLRDPNVERRRRRLARDQAQGEVKYEALEKEAYECLGLGGEKYDQRGEEGGVTP